MNQMQALRTALQQLRSELPALLGNDWVSFQASLDLYLQQPETDTSFVCTRILDLFSRYPRALQRLVELLSDLPGTESLVALAPGEPHKTKQARATALYSEVTRYSDVTLPREAEIGVPFALVVRVTVASISDGARELVLQVPEGERMVEVTVIVRPNGLELTGSNLRNLHVPMTADSDPVHFELVGRVAGTASVTADFFQGERYLGCVTAETYIKSSGAVIRANPVQTRGALSLAGAWEAPDLLIRVHESRGSDGTPRYHFELRSEKLGLFHSDAGEIGMPSRAEVWIDEQMKALTRMGRTLSTASDRVLASFGVDLYSKLIPPALQELYWSRLHEREDIQTVLMVSSDPWIPWEMIKPWRKIGDDIIEAPHWCERFAMTRWLNGQPPPQTLPCGEVAVIAPRDTGINAEQEVDMLDRIGIRVKRLEARLQPVLEFLQSDGCAGLHAVSHGIFHMHDVDQAELWLEMANLPDEDSREMLYPRLLNGRCLQFGRAKPLVFLNACNCGRSDFSYWGLGGWARAFVAQAGCSAFVAPFWEVEDDRALWFAETFYTELLKGKPIGEAMRLARSSTKQTNNPTWLAYCVYAHPNARLATS